MNVIISNDRQEELSNLNIEVIKNMDGVFLVDDIISTFKNFYFNKMILDVTAVKDYMNFSNIEKLAKGLDVSKVIFFLPDDQDTSSMQFLSKLVTLGIYNFTNNIDGVKYLLEHTNTREDVSYVKDEEEVKFESLANNVDGGVRVIGVKSVTEHAGATTLIYMMKKELEKVYGETIYAVEVDKHDFDFYNIKNTVSASKTLVEQAIKKMEDAKVIFVDLNTLKECPSCDIMIYLIEPSSIMLNRLMRVNRNVFKDLLDKHIILNKSMLDEKDIQKFEYEANTKILCNIPPLDDRIRNDQVGVLLAKLGLIKEENVGENKENKLFGIFKI